MFLGSLIPAALAESARDVQGAIREASGRRYLTDRRDEATILVQITGREGQRRTRVHAHVTTTDGGETDVTGTSTHQWKQSAQAVGDRLMKWVKANEAAAARVSPASPAAGYAGGVRQFESVAGFVIAPVQPSRSSRAR